MTNREWLLSMMARYSTYEDAQTFAIGCEAQYLGIWGAFITRDDWEEARAAA